MLWSATVRRCRSRANPAREAPSARGSAGHGYARARTRSAREGLGQLDLGAVPLAARALAALEAAVGLHEPGLRVVFEVGLDAFLHDAVGEFLVEHRKGELDAAEEIPVHPIGAREPHAARLVAEHEDARVLEEAPDDRTHMDVLGKTFHARPQCA